MVIVKDRLKSTANEAFDLLHNGFSKKVIDGFSESEKETLEEFLFTKVYNCMQPMVLIRYDRKALESIFGLDFRVTFDYNIEAARSRWLDQPNYKKITSNTVIMEVKYNNVLPSWFHDIILKYQLSRDTFSKYYMSVERCIFNSTVLI